MVYEHLSAVIPTENLDRIMDTPTEWDLWEDEESQDSEKLMRASTLLGMKAND